MNEKNRTIILFGAGAAIPWGGPSTSYLTELTRKSGTSSFTTTNGEPVIEIINKALLNAGHKDEETNFETLINAIEELIIHFAYHDGKTRTPSINKALFKSIFGDAFSNFSIAGGGVEEHGYRLNIPKEQEYNFAKSAFNYESPYQFYFQHLLSVILININARISSYAFHKQDAISNGSLSKLNKEFIAWYSSLSDNSLVRMYTLNYDRNFKFLAEQTGNPIFEGFKTLELHETRFVDSVLDLNRVLNDFDTPNHYNLHGSSYWEVHTRDEITQLNDMWVSLRPYISLASISDSPSIQIDKGKNVLVNNIITGYHKTQKSFASPFRQMQASFDRDCMLTNKIIVVGYSFGDFHINSSILNALKYNKKVTLHIIDPAYAEKGGKKGYDLLVQRLIDIFPFVFRLEKSLGVYTTDRDSCTYFDKKLTVSMIDFDKYLESYSPKKTDKA